MAQVPYSGAPEVGPALDPLPTPRVNAPAEAFGSGIAGAITHLGETAQGAGKELFGRAYAMQELDEQIKADTAAADVTDKMTKRYLEYDQLKGNERVAGYPQFQQDLAKIREDGGAGLTSPYAKVQYLRDSRRTQNSMIWHGGTLARQGMDEANKVAQHAITESVGDNLASTGTSDGPIYDKAMADAKTSLAQTVYRETGFPPGTPENDQLVKDHLSKVNTKIAGALISGPHPEKGKDFLDRGVRNESIRASDALPLAIHAENAIETKGARGVAHEVASGTPEHWGNEAYDTPLALRGLKAGTGTSGAFNSVGPKLADGSYQVGAYGVNSELLAEKLPGLNLTSESGRSVTTEEDFRNSPQAQRQFAEQVFADLQRDKKTFTEAYKTWTGDESGSRLNPALHEIAKGADPKLVRDKAAAAAADKFPNSPLAEDNASDLAAVGQERRRRTDLLSDMDKRKAVIDGITNSLDGRVPTSLDEALKDKGFAEKYYQLEDSDQRAVMKVLQDNAKLGGVRENGNGLRIYQELKSHLLNADTTTDPHELEKALSTNPLQLPLSPGHISEIMSLQHKVMAGAGGNVYVNRAMGLPAVQKLLTDAGVDKRSNPDEFAKFSIAYHDAISGFDEGANRRPSDEELEKIAKSLVVVTPGRWWGTNVDKKYTDIYGSLDKDDRGRKVQREAADAFLKKNGIEFDRDNPDHVERMNRLLNQMIFSLQGAGAGPKMKRTERAQ